MAASRLELLKHTTFVLALLFLSVNLASHKHLVHAGPAKLITVAHEVRRDLAHAERESLKTSVLSGRGEASAYPLPETAVKIESHEILLNSYPLSHLPINLQSKNISLDLSPVLNL
jgi:hypothetical protein